MNLTNFYLLMKNNLIRIKVDSRQYYANFLKNWRHTNSTKVLFISENSRIAKSQIFPFYYYAKDFYKRWNIEFREININLFEENPNNFVGGADVVFFQPWFQKGEKKMVHLLNSIHNFNPSAKVIFLDSFAPLDLRFAKAVNPLVDFYIKKQFFGNYSVYGQATYGDTNLVEYYNHLYGVPKSPLVQYEIPAGFLDKLVIGPSFFTSREMLPLLASSNKLVQYKKTINVHARLGKEGTVWYQKMREHALLVSSNFSHNSIITSASVSKSEYMKELKSSRVCFSPFGYGEVCWRDYEAIMCGALLIKPDMAHVKTEPNIFIPFETYIPVAWDFSDLEEKVTYYLENTTAREKIIQSAYDVLQSYIRDKVFMNQVAILFDN